MGEELVEMMQKFRLKEKECDLITITEEMMGQGIQSCSRSLVGKIVGDKLANFVGVKNTMNKLWGYPKKFEVVEIGANIFQFSFGKQEELEEVLNGRPWLFEGQLLVLKKWSKGIEYEMEKFATERMWVQLWHLPIHWCTREVGIQIGNAFEAVHDVIIPSGGGKEGRHLKVLAEVNLHKPLLRGVPVGCENMGKWIAFRYERCPDFCYICGIIGHSEKHCRNREVGSEGKEQYGGWLKASNQRSPESSSMVAIGGNNDQMNTEDSMAEDPVQPSTTAPVFGQQTVSPSPGGFVFGSTLPSQTGMFQFGGQQNQGAPQNTPLFQETGSQEFSSAEGSFSLGSGGMGGDKSGRKYIRVTARNKNRKK